MKAIFRSTHILVAALLVLLGISGTAIAGPVMECCRHGRYSGDTGDLNVADIKALNEERNAFSDGTRDLCQDTCSKELKLQTEHHLKARRG